MLINEGSKDHTNENDLFLEGIIHINSSQWSQAYVIFRNLTASAENHSIEICYNMALCHFAAKEFSKALYYLNEASAKLKKIIVFSDQSEFIPDILLNDEYSRNSHLLAITSQLLKLNSSTVRLRIKKLLVDTNLQMENWLEIIRLASLPNMMKCKNVFEAVEIANNKINK